MTADPKLVAEFLTLTPMDFAVLEDQSREQLYLAKRTRWKYRRELQQALADYERECRERQPKPVLKPRPQPLNPAPATAAVCGGVVFAVGGLVLFFLTLWGLQNLGRAIIK